MDERGGMVEWMVDLVVVAVVFYVALPIYCMILDVFFKDVIFLVPIRRAERSHGLQGISQTNVEAIDHGEQNHTATTKSETQLSGADMNLLRKHLPSRNQQQHNIATQKTHVHAQIAKYTHTGTVAVRRSNSVFRRHDSLHGVHRRMKERRRWGPALPDLVHPASCATMEGEGRYELNLERFYVRCLTADHDGLVKRCGRLVEENRALRERLGQVKETAFLRNIWRIRGEQKIAELKTQVQDAKDRDEDHEYSMRAQERLREKASAELTSRWEECWKYYNDFAALREKQQTWRRAKQQLREENGWLRARAKRLEKKLKELHPEMDAELGGSTTRPIRRKSQYKKKRKTGPLKRRDIEAKGEGTRTPEQAAVVGGVRSLAEELEELEGMESDGGGHGSS